MAQPNIRYDKRVIVITGAGAGLGRAYAHFFASRGGLIVVNDLGGTFNGSNDSGKGQVSSKVADTVVNEIRAAGGTAVANYDPVQQGDKIIATAIENFGRVDVLINNAGILRDVTLRNMKDEDWDKIVDVHLNGAFKTARAAWPYMRKQRYGRIVNTTSASGLFGNFGQSNYAAAKMALVGLTETLAAEGKKYGIGVNVLAPGAASRLTRTVWSEDMMDIMKPDWVVPLVGVLCHESCTETGAIFEAAAGHQSKIRWERSRGWIGRADETLTADVVLKNHDKIMDWSNPEHTGAAKNALEMLEKAMALPKNQPGQPLDFKDKVVLVTGGGEGLGRAYAVSFAKHGAKVVVNDVVGAEKVADSIKQNGGEATALTMTVERGAEVVKAVVDKYGRIDVVVNNAGILADKAFANMTDEMWNKVISVHLRGTYAVTRAAFPYMLKQRYGRIVNITSTSGVYGNFGQANYAAAKCGIVGFSKTIAREGAKYNIIVNSVAPVAGTNMTRTVRPEEEVQMMKPEYVAPLILALCCDKPPATGQLYECGVGWFAATRWQRARGYSFEHAKGVMSVEDVAKVFSEVCNFDNGQADNPDTPQDGSKYTNGNAMKNPKVANAIAEGQKLRDNRKYISKIEQALKLEGKPCVYTYTDIEPILYALSLGVPRTNLPLVFERDPQFHVLPTFGIVPTYHATASYSLADLMPNFDPRMLLHGEQFLEIRRFPIPTSGTLTTTTKLIEVVDKGAAALVRRASTTVDEQGSEVFYNEGVSFHRGSGGFGGARKGSDRGAATAENKKPERKADQLVEEKTSEEMAALYRLLGDRNPLHIDPEFSRKGGFEVPILHGLATFGIAGKHIYQTYGAFKNIKVRFAGTVLPGQTLVTEMWKVENGKKILFQVKVKETGKVCISGGGAELVEGGAGGSKL